MKKDIENIDDIKLMVDTFYDKVNQDDLLSFFTISKAIKISCEPEVAAFSLETM